MQLLVFVQSSRALPPVMVLAAGILRRQVKKKKRERDGQPVSQKDGVSIKKENRIIFQLAGQKVTKKTV